VRKFVLLSSLFVALVTFAAEPTKVAPKEKDGFVPMFNGKDLTGWVNANTHSTTFTVKDGMIVTNGKPMGFLRTEKQYENFEMEFEWFHVNKKDVGNSGLFVWGDPLPAIGTVYTRGIEVQVLVNYETDWATSHGDIFSIWGAKCKPDREHPKKMERCLPSERVCKGGGEWNHYRVVANDGKIKLSVNGKEVSGVSESNPRKGYLALESEGAETHFKNLKIKELPSTNPKPEEIAEVYKGQELLFNGLDFTGWTTEEKTGTWKAGGSRILVTPKAAEGTSMSRKHNYRKELQFDANFPDKKNDQGAITVAWGDDKTFPSVTVTSAGEVKVHQGEGERDTNITNQKDLLPGKFFRVKIVEEEKELVVFVNNKQVIKGKKVMPKTDPKLYFTVSGAPVELTNLYGLGDKSEK